MRRLSVCGVIGGLLFVVGCGGTGAVVEGAKATATGSGDGSSAVPPPDGQELAAERYKALSKTADGLEAGKKLDVAWLETQLNEVLQLNPQHREARFNRAKIQELRGERDAAEAVYRKLYEENASFIPAAEEIARIYVRRGETQKAENLYRANIQNDPKNTTSRLALARILLRQRQYKDAMALCREVLQREARSVEAFRILARAFYERKDLPMAELVIGRGLKVDENDPYLRYTLAQVYFARDDLVDGVDELKRVIALDPGWLKVRAELAAIALKYRDYGNAAQQYEAIVQIEKKNPDARMALAASYTGMGRYDQAEKIYKSLIAQDGAAVNPRWNLANLYVRSGKTSEAVALLQGLQSTNEPGLSEQLNPLLTRLQREVSDAAALKERQQREQARSEAVAASCSAVQSGQKSDPTAIGNDQERVEAAWQLMVDAQQLVEQGSVPDGERKAACAFDILPKTEGVKVEACAPMRVMWTQILYQLGRVDDAVQNTKLGLECDPKNPELLLIEQQLQELSSQAGAKSAVNKP